MTPEQWLQIPDDKLGVELAKVLVKKPWKHQEKNGAYPNRECVKCGKKATYHVNCEPYDKSSCPVRDPIKIDWNTAMEWRDKVPLDSLPLFLEAMETMWRLEKIVVCFEDWAICRASPKHYLIAAAMAAEGAKE